MINSPSFWKQVRDINILSNYQMHKMDTLVDIIWDLLIEP